ncbi:MFS general substrate transporter [Collybia nuda]|uniref:MFS general substrate transporter n=1 Tax=Collybia nuda TaxID=64659 RepID=A0A9P5Y5T5_9AGAR|nr:MFS general substrate transporter [Collybia nuda]
MCNTFSTFGFVNSWGVFQAYYQENTLRDSSPSNIAWIGSIQFSLIFLPGILVGRLFDLGYFRSIFLTSAAVLVTSTFLIAQCTEYWQFLLCQGLAAGFACGGMFGPTTAVISHWFKRRRGLAMGVVTIGSSIGGTIIPIAAHRLIPLVGFQWAIRTIGFILLFVQVMANLTLKRRLPAANSPGGLLNLKAFKSAPFTCFCLSAFFIFLGIYTALTYVEISALTRGVPMDLSFYLVAIANASSLFGRYIAGILADRIGPINVMIPMATTIAVFTYAWPFAHSKASLIVIMVLYGFATGGYVSLLSNPLMALGETNDIGRRIGMYMSILSLGALAGPPISGAINRASGGFNVVGYYAGSMVMIGVGFMCITRQLVLRRLVGKF